MSTEIVEYDETETHVLAEPVTAVQAITRAEIDTQIATAKAYPRSLTRFVTEAKGLVAMDPELAAECTFVLPERIDQNGKKVEISGPSVRLAEIVAFCWGNLSVGARIVDDDGKFLTAQAVAFDSERNNRRVVEVKRSVTTRKGRRFSDDMVRVTAMAAMSIAKRNVTFEVVPRSLVNIVEQEAKRIAIGEIRTLPERTARAVSWFVAKGIAEHRVFASLGIAGAADMTLDLLQRLNGYRTAVNEGTATLEELFPVASEHAAGPAGESRAEALARKIGGLSDEAARQEFGPGADG